MDLWRRGSYERLCMATIYEVRNWVEKTGPARSVDRFRMKLLPHSVRERINFDQLNPTTEVSDTYMQAAIKIAGEVVGKPFAA